MLKVLVCFALFVFVGCMLVLASVGTMYSEWTGSCAWGHWSTRHAVAGRRSAGEVPWLELPCRVWTGISGAHVSLSQRGCACAVCTYCPSCCVDRSAGQSARRMCSVLVQRADGACGGCWAWGGTASSGVRWFVNWHGGPLFP